MLELDGAHLEGGGQLVRTAVALAALTGEGVTIARVRAGRETPGLRPQHLAAVRAVAGCCGAEVEGLAIGSDRLVFSPGPLRQTDQRIEVGTAGGIALVLQAWLPVALEAGGAITVVGGTEVPLGPTIDFVDRVLLRLLRAHGARATLELRHRGYVAGGRGRGPGRGRAGSARTDRRGPGAGGVGRRLGRSEPAPPRPRAAARGGEAGARARDRPPRRGRDRPPRRARRRARRSPAGRG